VGSYSVPGIQKSLVEYWNGSDWSIMTSPSPTDSTYLIGVSCPSLDRCFAVGSDTAPKTGAVGALVEYWNGYGWSIMNSPKPTRTTTTTYLDWVSCPSTNSCFAVGTYGNIAGFPKSLVEHWVHGRPWSIMTSPNPAGSTGTFLKSVSCMSATTCFAVGHYSTASTTFSLVERNK